MKVKELITILQNLDPNLPVYRYVPGSNLECTYDSESEIYDVETSTHITHNSKQDNLQLNMAGNPKKFYKRRYYLRNIVLLT